MNRIYCLQLDSAWEQVSTNHARVLEWLERERPEPGSLIVLPEMFATGFSMNVDGIAEPVQNGKSAEFLAIAAARFKTWIVGGLVTKSPEGRGRNMAVGFGPDGAMAVQYQKIKTFTPGGESAHYEPGTERAVFNWPPLRCGVFVCYDLRFPELFTPLAKSRIELYLVIANWPRARTDHWVRLLRARAIENQAYLAGVNRCGEDPQLAYAGRTLVVDPKGEIIADAGGAESIISADIDLEFLNQYRSEFPVLDDR